MPSLYVEKGIDKGLTFPCNCDTPVIIGRGTSCTITLQDVSTSRNHFKIFKQDDQYYIEDMASRNGTRVNDENIQQPTLLQDGDLITAGETTLCWSVDQSRSTEPLVGTEINGYKIMKKLGRGGMGVVYLARQGFLEREVAFKIMMPKGTNAINNNELIQSFLQETRTYATFNHPNIIQIYDAGQWEEYFYFSMEYAPNGSLQDKISGCKSLPWEEALPYMLDTALGLEYAEKKQIVHCDIKPDNLLISDDNHIKIVDLGIACRMNQLKTDTKVYGTPHFVSPEQAKGLALDHRSDIYSFGATFYRILSGQTPFSGASSTELLWKHVNSTPEPIKELVPNLPDSIAKMIQKMMQKNLDERYKSNTDIIADIHKIMDRSKRHTTISKPSTLKSSPKVNSVSNVNKITMSMTRRELNARLKQKRDQQRKKNFIIFSIVLGILTILSILVMLIVKGIDLSFLNNTVAKKELSKEEKKTLEILKKRYEIIVEHHINNPENVDWLKKQYTMLLQESPDKEFSQQIKAQLQKLELSQEKEQSEQKHSKDEIEDNDTENSFSDYNEEDDDSPNYNTQKTEENTKKDIVKRDSDENNDSEDSEDEYDDSEQNEDSEDEYDDSEQNDILKDNQDVDEEDDLTQQEDNSSIDESMRNKYIQKWNQVKKQVDDYDAKTLYYNALREIRNFTDSCPQELERIFKDEVDKKRLFMVRKSKDVITNYCHKINNAVQFKQKRTINQYLDLLKLYHKEPELTKYVELKYSQLESALKRVGISVPVKKDISDSEVKTYYQKNIIDLYYKIQKEVKMSSAWQKMVLELSQNIKEFEKKYGNTKFFKDLQKQ